jgi:serine phosphatase RsbU (regulator of sigma subunit)
VTGKGLPAAAVMGQLRSALTAATYGSDGPPQALEVLDLYARSVVGALGATVVQVDLDRALRRIRYARAGHLPPLAIGPEGAATFLEQAGGPPLATGGAAMPAAEVAFPAGATLVLYTDGLVERRRRHIDSGLAALAQAAGRHAGLEVEAMADAILHALLDDEPAPDDAVLVVARAD